MLRRVVVLGVTGAGKSTVAGRLARLMAADHVELDAFHHGPDWVPRSDEEFAARLAGVVALPRWVADGNYASRVSGVLWPRADLIVWLDLPLRVVLPRIVRRTVRRIRQRTELWSGNRERWGALVGRGSLLWWAVTSRRRYRAVFPVLLAGVERAGVRVVRLRSTAAVEQWLAEQG